MLQGTILCIPRSDAIRYAETQLAKMGFHVTRTPAPDVSYVLLPVPSFPSGDEYLAHIMAELPDHVIVAGGNLSSLLLKNYAVVDFLQDPIYLAENAAITASCTLGIVRKELKRQLAGSKVLIVGWGRIGKCLHRLFEKEGAEITISVRSKTDRAMIHALGSRSLSIEEAAAETQGYDVIINTVPAMVLPNLAAHENALVLELASKPGLSGGNIMNCRGLPGKLAPAASGELIAKTFVRMVLGKEAT